MKLILVYNADDGLFNAVTDTIHKIMSPSTYECRLCQFTYGLTGMLKKWRDFLSDWKMEKQFLHRKEFRELYPDHAETLPAIYLARAQEIGLLISSDEINACENLDELIALVDSRVIQAQRV